MSRKRKYAVTKHTLLLVSSLVDIHCFDDGYINDCIVHVILAVVLHFVL